MERGYIKLWRKTLEDPAIQNCKLFTLWITLLLLANHKTHKIIWNNEELEVEKGQILTGRKKLSEITHLSEQTIRTCLTTLKSTSKITIKTYPKFSVITIKKYEDYQSSNQMSNQQLTSNQPATNQQLTTYKNDKNDKNDKNEQDNPLTPLLGGGGVSEKLFLEWKNKNREWANANPKLLQKYQAEISAGLTRGVTAQEIEKRIWDTAGQGLKPWELFPKENIKKGEIDESIWNIGGRSYDEHKKYLAELRANAERMDREIAETDRQNALRRVQEPA